MICAAGELLIDFTSAGMNEYSFPVLSPAPGGAPANFLSAVKNSGTDAAFIGKVGNDVFGRRLVEILREKGIDVRGIVIDDSVFTTLAFVTLDENGERDFSFARKPGADTCLDYSEVNKDIIDQCDIFHFGSLSFTHEPSRSTVIRLIEYAKSKNKLISYDPNYRAPLWKSDEDARQNMLTGMKYADIIKMSRDEAEFIFSTDYITASRILSEEYPCSLVFVTLGKDGCYYRNKSFSGHAAAEVNVTPVDTTGAGDIFGGTAASLILKSGMHPSELNGDILREIAVNACTKASLSTEKFGGMI